MLIAGVKETRRINLNVNECIRVIFFKTLRIRQRTHSAGMAGSGRRGGF